VPGSARRRRGPTLNRRQVSERVYALVSWSGKLAEVQCDGRDHVYTDKDRWRTPTASPAVQYLCGDEDVARARAASVAEESGISLADISSRRGPALLDVTIDQGDAADLTTAAGLQAVGLPVTYPTGGSTAAIRAACRHAGDDLVDHGETLIAVLPVEAIVRTHYELLAVLGSVTMRVTGRRRFGEWCR
jgi:hypothetical protein